MHSEMCCFCYCCCRTYIITTPYLCEVKTLKFWAWCSHEDLVWCINQLWLFCVSVVTARGWWKESSRSDNLLTAVLWQTVFFLVVIEEHTDVQFLFQTHENSYRNTWTAAFVNGNESVLYVMCFFKLFRRFSGKWEPWRIKVWVAVSCLRSGNS